MVTSYPRNHRVIAQAGELPYWQRPEVRQVFGLIKIKLLLTFTLAAYNLETIRSFRARKAVEAEKAKKPRPRRKRLRETWRDGVAIRPATGPDPPPA